MTGELTIVRRLASLGVIAAAAAGVLASPEVAGAQSRFELLHVLDGRAEGAYPKAALIQASDGDFYGTTDWSGYGNNLGTVFRITALGSISIVHAFTGGAGGAHPRASLIQATDGNFYGTTAEGGASSLGTVFRLSPSGAFTVLHSFTGPDGAYPRASLVQASDGRLYGTTYGGDSAGNGTIFRMTPAGAFDVLHVFANVPDGANPAAALIQATDGAFYGTTARGGVPGVTSGTVFRMTASGTVTVLHAFAGGTDGAVPEAALLQATDGNFYGTTSNGGGTCCGTVFKITAAGNVTILHAFNGDGAFPLSPLIEGMDGAFYGTTINGGTAGNGTIYRITPAGILTVLFSFIVGPNGNNPDGSLIQATDGNLYGTASLGGIGFGVVFRVVLGPPPPRQTHLLDLDGDGAGDVLLYNQASGERKLEVTNGLSGFTETPGAWDAGWQVYAVNLNRDRYIDFFLYSPHLGLWAQALNDSGSGSFIYTFGYWDRNWAVLPADLDGNGVTDLFVYNAATGAWVKCLVDGNGGFAWFAIGRWDPDWTLHAADLNGDGRDDFFLYNRKNGAWVEAFSQQGFGGFDYPASGRLDTGWQFVPGDLDGDGRTDLFLLTAAGVHVSALSRAAGGFDYVAGPQWSPGWSVSPGDLNGDGSSDLFLYNTATGVWVEAFSDGAGGFTYANGHWDPNWSVAVIDFSGDGRDDVVLSRGDGTWVKATNAGAATFNYTAGNWGAGWTVFTRRLGDR